MERVAKKVGKSWTSLRRKGFGSTGKNPSGGIGNGKGKNLGGEGRGRRKGFGSEGWGRRKGCRGQRNGKGKNLGGEGQGRRKGFGTEKRKRSRLGALRGVGKKDGFVRGCVAEAG